MRITCAFAARGNARQARAWQYMSPCHSPCTGVLIAALSACVLAPICLLLISTSRLYLPINVRVYPVRCAIAMVSSCHRFTSGRSANQRARVAVASSTETPQSAERLDENMMHHGPNIRSHDIVRAHHSVAYTSCMSTSHTVTTVYVHIMSSSHVNEFSPSRRLPIRNRKIECLCLPPLRRIHIFQQRRRRCSTCLIPL